MALPRKRARRKRPSFTWAGAHVEVHASPVGIRVDLIAWPRIVAPRRDDAGRPKAGTVKLLARPALTGVGTETSGRLTAKLPSFDDAQFGNPPHPPRSSQLAVSSDYKRKPGPRMARSRKRAGAALDCAWRGSEQFAGWGPLPFGGARFRLARRGSLHGE